MLLCGTVGRHSICNTSLTCELLQGISETTNFTSNEIMYNSLPDGCARQDLWERALSVLSKLSRAISFCQC